LEKRTATAEPNDIDKPSDIDKTPPALLGMSPQAKQQTASNEDELTRLQILGCDTPIRRGVLHALDAIGSIAVPSPVAYILGTEALWQMYNPQLSKG
jgi:hypothetical protein